MDQKQSSTDPHVFGSLMLDTGMGLLKAGASGRRIRTTVTRISSAFNYHLHLDLGPKSISITLLDDNFRSVFAGSRSTITYGVDFKVISAIDRLSFSVTNQRWSMPEMRSEVNRLLNLPKYPFIWILLAVSVAGAAFCYTFGGSIAAMFVTFGATFCGMFIKHQLQKKAFNVYATTFVSALVASLFVGLVYISGPVIKLESAYATCSLFLIPGVPLINSIIDMMDGNILYGLERGVNAMIHALAIAFGLTTTLYIFNLAG